MTRTARAAVYAGRTLFWKDVLLTLQLSNEMLFQEAGAGKREKFRQPLNGIFCLIWKREYATVETGESF